MINIPTGGVVAASSNLAVPTELSFRCFSSSAKAPQSTPSRSDARSANIDSAVCLATHFYLVKIF